MLKGVCALYRLYAGAGCGTIHFPDALFPMEGFCGVHDAPVARVLVLECGEKVALVSLELVMLPPELVDVVKNIVSEHTAIEKENIWVHTTHAITTPHAPNAPVGPGGVPIPLGENDRQYLEEKKQWYTEALCAAVREATRAAAERFCPAVMGTAQGESRISINRDVETPFGWWIGQNPAGKTNPIFQMLRFDDGEGKPIAVLFNGGLKPCAIDNSQMKEGRRLVSSDVAGLACCLMESEMQAPCLFFMGAAGDQATREQALLEEVLADGTVEKRDLGVEAGLKMVDRLGHQLAKDLLPTMKAIRCKEAAPAIVRDKISVVWGGKERTPMKPRKSVCFTKDGDVKIDGDLLTMGEIAIIGLKPEVNCITAEELAVKSPFDRTILISMVNGGQKYMPDARSYERITWEAQSSMMMAGAAEAWVEAVCEKLKKMHG